MDEDVTIDCEMYELREQMIDERKKQALFNIRSEFNHLSATELVQLRTDINSELAARMWLREVHQARLKENGNVQNL